MKTVSNNQDNFFDNKKIFRLNKKGYDAYLVSAYVVTLTKSNVYRTAALKSLLELLHTQLPGKIQTQTIFVKLRTPKKQFLDYGWNERITQTLLERREVDHAMSWLSTLGGAFSALGEEFRHCAEIAGKISVQQFQLALRLGDPLLIARCKLYAALSLIQQGHLRIAKHIVINIYKFASDKRDIRLQNMCQGIWAKLKYCYKLQKQQKLSL
ncbi:hypothetical protein KM043_005514 [Ampulex compressa]|nr:hypothetical protein KM043_005514 [Ampulex compressa]